MLLVSPIVLFLLGVFVARVSKARRVWRRHSLFTVKVGILIIAFYTLLSLAFLFDAASVRDLAEWAGADDGTAFFVGSGFRDVASGWPIEDTRLMALVILSFMLYPFWFWLGANAGYWAFGRSPKQTGVLGLLR